MDATCRLGDGDPVKSRGMCNRHYNRWRLYGDPDAPRKKIRRVDPVARFVERTAPGPVPPGRPDLGPCLLWTGPPNGNGYGTAWDGQRSVGAHVLAVELSGRLIFPGEVPDHLCRVRLCVAAEHLEVVPVAVNVDRAVALRDTRPPRALVPA